MELLHDIFLYSTFSLTPSSILTKHTKLVAMHKFLSNDAVELLLKRTMERAMSTIKEVNEWFSSIYVTLMPFNRFDIIRWSLKENVLVENVPAGSKHEQTKQTLQLTVKHFYFAQMEETIYICSYEQVAPPGVAWVFISQCDGLCSSQSSECGTF